MVCRELLLRNSKYTGIPLNTINNPGHVVARVGRRCVNRDVKELILRMVAKNSTWGAPRIHGELKMLGWSFGEGQPF